VDTSRRTDLAMMVWLLRGNGRNVLVDAGFHRPDLIARWKPVGFVLPSEAVANAGVRPEEVTDIIVSHIHWDHFDGVDLFPKATIWIQRDEVEHHVDSTGKVLDRAIDGPDAQMLARLRREGRIRLVEGDSQQIIPGITVYIGGKHTFQSQYAVAHTNAGTVVLASDNVYLYENLERHAPIAQTLDAASNLRAQDRMLTLTSDRRLIVPGHDPEVMRRFPTVKENVVAIR
jgi:glyoxylase-like metal-dependent hydrolase (beta-lactamase superfamily II)